MFIKVVDQLLIYKTVTKFFAIIFVFDLEKFKSLIFCDFWKMHKVKFEQQKCRAAAISVGFGFLMVENSRGCKNAGPDYMASEFFWGRNTCVYALQWSIFDT